MSRAVKLLVPIAVLLVVVACNTDWVLIPSLHNRALTIGPFITPIKLAWLPYFSKWQVAVMICSFALFQNVYLYWFLGWLGQTIVHSPNIQKDIRLLKQEGILDAVKRHMVRWHSDMLQNKWIAHIKRYGFVGVFIIGILPDIAFGSKGGVVVACRIMNWRAGFIVFLVMELVKDVYMSFLWGTYFG